MIDLGTKPKDYFKPESADKNKLTYPSIYLSGEQAKRFRKEAGRIALGDMIALDDVQAKVVSISESSSGTSISLDIISIGSTENEGENDTVDADTEDAESVKSEKSKSKKSATDRVAESV